MKRLSSLLLSLFCSLSLFAGESDIRRAQTKASDQYIVKFDDSIVGEKARGLANAIAKNHGAKIHHVFESVVPGAIVSMSEAQAKALLRNPLVEYIEEDALSESSVQLNPPWHLDRVDQRHYPLDQRYYDACPGPVNNAIAYVLDTGIRAGHSEFWRTPSDPVSRVIDGRDFVALSQANPSAPVIDRYVVGESMNPCTSTTACTGECLTGGHGTAVASVLAGLTYGVAKDLRLISVRTHTCGAASQLTNIALALEWIYHDYPTRNAPAVLNMSNTIAATAACKYSSTWGTACVSTIENWISRLVNERNITVVAAAHNAQDDATNWVPARKGNDVEGLVVVGGTSRVMIDGLERDARWVCNSANSFEICDTGNVGSNYGADIDIWAPAQNIPSAGIRALSGTTWVNSSTGARSTHRSGTSFAAPIVAGMAARILFNTQPGGYYPLKTPAEVESILKADASVNIIANPADGTVPGAGPLNPEEPYNSTPENNRFIFRQGPTICRQ